MTDAALADPTTAVGRLRELAADLRLQASPDGVAIAEIHIGGVTGLAFATDPKVQGGALSGEGCRALAALTERAASSGLPVIGIWQSGGARLQEGVTSLDGMGAMFSAMTVASGLVPQIAVVVGPAAGGAAYGTALADIVITAPEARLFVTGPDVVRQVTGESIDALGLGGPEPHSRQSGLVHVAASSLDEALSTARQVMTLMSQPMCTGGHGAESQPLLRTALPERRRLAYDVRGLLGLLLDGEHSPLELHARWAPNLVTMLGRLGGRTVGVLANNPIRLAGCLDGRASDKAARFVRMCDSLGVPLVVVVDVPGYLPGVKQEHDGIVRRGAKLLHAFAEASVPRVTLITHKAYGGAYIAMNSKSLGATAVLAWPGARLGVMGGESAIQVLHRRHLAALAPEERQIATDELVSAHDDHHSLERAVEQGSVDAVIDPADSRTEIFRCLSLAPDRRGRHGNIPL